MHWGAAPKDGVKVAVVIPETCIQRLVECLLARNGHETHVVSRVEEVRPQLLQYVDLVIIDGDEAAAELPRQALHLAANCGDGRPSVLCISDSPEALEALPSFRPSHVLGCLLKPFFLSELSQVLDIAARTRTRCPGMLPPPFRCSCSAVAETPQRSLRLLCNTCHYAECKLYAVGPGLTLWKWIADRRARAAEAPRLPEYEPPPAMPQMPRTPTTTTDSSTPDSTCPDPEQSCSKQPLYSDTPCWACRRYNREVAHSNVTFPAAASERLPIAEELNHIAACAMEACGRLTRIPEPRGPHYEKFLITWQRNQEYQSSHYCLDALSVNENGDESG